MCGLLFTNEPSIGREKFLTALDVMKHRGPDALGYASHGEALLGHNRLKIVDLDDRSNQPFYSKDRRYAIVFNGEIYNFRELAREHDVKQETTCDTEVLVELYARYGARCLGWLNGMFAFVVYDTLTHETFAARDRLGVKPLYMCRRNGRITFSSEISPLIELGLGFKYDDVGLRQYRKLRAFFNGRTVWAGIEMFPAAHYFEHGRLCRYWQLPENTQPPPADNEIRSMIEESVRQRRIADVPIGSYLSGGLDSTIIAALSHEPHTWTVGFPDHNEFVWARLAAEHIGSIHHEVIITPEEFEALAIEMINRRKEPLSVPNEVLLYKMTREVKSFNTVILSGEGADELFFGYDRIFRWAASAKTFDVREFDRLYSYGTHDDFEIVEDVIAPYLYLDNPIAIVAAFFQTAHLHGLLRRLDNSTMLCSVEARVPFVDYHPLVERMAGVPFVYRLSDDVVKAPLKRSFAKDIPAEILQRKKEGFPVPLERLTLKGGLGSSGMDRWLSFNLAVLSSVVSGK